ncbi:AMP-binding protein [Streptomyces sp. NPDC055037]
MVKSTASQRSQATDAYGAGRSGRVIIQQGVKAVDIFELVEVFGPVMTQLFGQAEAPFACTVLTREDIAAADLKHRGRLASCGRPTLAARVEIMNDLGDLLGPSEQGEIVVRLDLVFGGYWKDPEASTETRRPGGWHGTGDIGYRDVRVAVGASCGRVITLGITRLCRSPGRSPPRPADSPPPESAAISGASARRLPARPERRNPPRPAPRRHPVPVRPESDRRRTTPDQPPAAKRGGRCRVGTGRPFDQGRQTRCTRSSQPCATRSSTWRAASVRSEADR